LELKEIGIINELLMIVTIFYLKLLNWK